MVFRGDTRILGFSTIVHVSPVVLGMIGAVSLLGMVQILQTYLKPSR